MLKSNKPSWKLNSGLPQRCMMPEEEFSWHCAAVYCCHTLKSISPINSCSRSVDIDWRRKHWWVQLHGAHTLLQLQLFETSDTMKAVPSTRRLSTGRAVMPCHVPYRQSEDEMQLRCHGSLLCGGRLVEHEPSCSREHSDVFCINNGSFLNIYLCHLWE